MFYIVVIDQDGITRTRLESRTFESETHALKWGLEFISEESDFDILQDDQLPRGLASVQLQDEVAETTNIVSLCDFRRNKYVSNAI